MLDINKIYCGDNSEVIRLIDNDSIDLVVTSPPYDQIRSYKGYSWNFEVLAKELYRVIKPGGVIVWVVGDQTINGSETGTSFEQVLYFRDIGFNIHDTMIWQKISPYQHKNRYIQCFEYMFILSKGSPNIVNLIKDRKNKWAGVQIHGTERQKDGSIRKLSMVQKSKTVKPYGSRYNIWDIPPVKTNKNGEHPAPFPEDLARDHIITWSNPGDIVLDPFVGSGTTPVACKKLKRNYIGIDISEEYCDLTISNIEMITKQITLL